jgi:transposase
VLAFALGENTGKLGFTTGAAPRPRARQVAAGASSTVWEEMRRATHRFGWPDNPRVVRGDEAGRDGVGLQRCFGRQGREHAVVDAASMAVHRRARRAQTDRLDGPTRRTRRLRDAAGERHVWRVVRVPRVAEEARRQRHRARLTAQRDRTRVSQRMPGVLAGYGVRRARHGDVEAQRAQGPQEDGALWPPALRARLTRAWPPVCCLTAPSTARAGARRAARPTRPEPVLETVRPWSTVRGIGVQRAWRCGLACLAWRDVQTPTPVGACAGRTPPPSHRGASRRARGMPQAGHGSRRTLAVEMAWGWRRFQPERLLTPWAPSRCGPGRARLRTSGLVALARTFLRALGRCLKTGDLPAGAVRNAAVSGERIPEDEQGPRSETRVWGWCGPRVAGHGVAARTDAEAGVSTPGVPGAQSAGRIGGVTPEVTTERRSCGARELHGSRSHQPRSEDTLPLDRPQGPGLPEVRQAIKRAGQARPPRRPPVVKRHPTPESGFCPFFSAGLQAERRPPLAPCSGFMSVGWCAHAAAPHTS